MPAIHTQEEATKRTKRAEEGQKHNGTAEVAGEGRGDVAHAITTFAESNMGGIKEAYLRCQLMTADQRCVYGFKTRNHGRTKGTRIQQWSLKIRWSASAIAIEPIEVAAHLRWV